MFTATSLLGYRFIPRIRDLPSKPLHVLHVFEPGRVPKRLTRLTGNKIREGMIVPNWRSLSAKSDKSNERSSSPTGCRAPDMQRRANTGLN